MTHCCVTFTFISEASHYPPIETSAMILCQFGPDGFKNIVAGAMQQSRHSRARAKRGTLLSHDRIVGKTYRGQVLSLHCTRESSILLCVYSSHSGELDVINRWPCLFVTLGTAGYCQIDREKV